MKSLLITPLSFFHSFAPSAPVSVSYIPHLGMCDFSDTWNHGPSFQEMTGRWLVEIGCSGSCHGLLWLGRGPITGQQMQLGEIAHLAYIGQALTGDTRGDLSISNRSVVMELL